MHDYGPKTSLVALEWLEYENRKYQRSSSSMTKIQHAFNGRGEKKIGKYHLDGYVEYESSDGHVWIGYEFMGCRFHQCPFDCGTHCMQTDEEYEKERDRIAFLRRNLTRLVMIYECEWQKLKLKIKEQEKKSGEKILTSGISQFLSQPSVTENEIIGAIANGTFYGLVCVDIHTPSDVIEKYKHLNFPFIFNNLSVTEELLSPETREMAEERKIKFPFLVKTLTWNTENFIACTPLLQFYIKLGMQVKNIRWALQYERGAPFKNFVEELVTERVKAKDESNEPRGERAKFCLNSAVGGDLN